MTHVSHATPRNSPFEEFKELSTVLQKIESRKINETKRRNNRVAQKFIKKKKLENPSGLSRVSTKKISAAKIVAPRQVYPQVNREPYFDIPVTYNSKVKQWIKYYQTSGRTWFNKWLNRSHRYLPVMKDVLKKRGLPQDLAYIAMIESGFSPVAVSHASAVGYWQFIKPTANRYGLTTSWWLDERRDFTKSTKAASAYLGDLYSMFRSWYLTAAAYNMGEGRTKKLIKRHGTNDFWALSKKRDFPSETREYIPKLLAAVLISKAPQLYGFHDIQPLAPYSYEYVYVPGGTDLQHLARHLGVKKRTLTRLNSELIKGFVPSFIKSHRIRVPRGSSIKVSQYLRKQIGS